MNLRPRIIRTVPVYLLAVLSFLNGCEEAVDEPEVTDDSPKLEVYYSLQNSSEKYSISDLDTINANLGDTLSISIHYTGGEFLGLSGGNALEVTDEGNGEYTGVVVKSGLSVIRAYMDPYVYGSTVQLVADYLLDIPTIMYIYGITSEPEITIEPDDDAVAVNSIRAELETSLYLPVNNTDYILTSRTIHGGDLIYRTVDRDSIFGTFTSSDASRLSNITMNYNDREYNFTVEETASGIHYCILKQDLTALFYDKYPNMNEVSVKTSAIKVWTTYKTYF
ncbi:MAG: hypothetical protein VB074_10070 [Proteiniphilum sp.]|uniref:hypothetical protein n=1 Tax=Proteiniphilum sp. TaxID=1926877 RepID=UPI002B1FF12C|nr:hypothetical protein [Proteiniphilum sp.]MEA5128521.1 hypothetical protein [Proteiniphilum sp.]